MGYWAYWDVGSNPDDKELSIQQLHPEFVHT